MYDLNPDLCDAGAVLHQLMYQANWCCALPVDVSDHCVYKEMKY